MVNKSEWLLAVILIAAPTVARASDSNPPTYTTTPTEAPKPAQSGKVPAATPAPAAVEAAAGVRTRQNLDRQIGETMAALAEAEQCVETENSLKGDLAKKKAQLNAEFKGKIPVAFNDLLWAKTQRINKQHAACALQYESVGKLFAALDTAFGTIEPKSLNVSKQRATADAGRQRYLRLLPTARPYNKPAPAKPAAEATE